MDDATQNPAEPQRIERGEHILCFRMTVAAPAEELYARASNPHRHHELDGSGSVRSTAIGPRELFEGDRFRVDMKKYGVPYALTMVTTLAESPRVVEWQHPAGHRWRWEFTPLDGDPARTVVTETYDATRQSSLVRRALSLARIPQQNTREIQDSLRKLHTEFAGG